MLFPCRAETAADTDLAAARATFAAQKKTLSEQYRGKLEALAKTQVQNGDLAAAAAIREEVKTLETASVDTTGTGLKGDGNPFFSGTKWWESNGMSVVEFRADGLWSECFKGREAFGRWKTDGDKTSVLITKPDGKTLQYQISQEGTTCTRAHDKLPYKKIVNYFREEAIAVTTAAPITSTPSSASPFAGTRWQSASGNSVVEFHADGSFLEHWNGKDTPGTWKTTGNRNVVELTWSRTKPMQFTLSDDGRQCTRSFDGGTYKPFTGATPAPSSPGAKGGGSNPFGDVR